MINKLNIIIIDILNILKLNQFANNKYYTIYEKIT